MPGAKPGALTEDCLIPNLVLMFEVKPKLPGVFVGYIILLYPLPTPPAVNKF